MEVLSLGTLGMKSYRKNLGRVCLKCVKTTPLFRGFVGFPTKSHIPAIQKSKLNRSRTGL